MWQLQAASVLATAKPSSGGQQAESLSGKQQLSCKLRSCGRPPTVVPCHSLADRHRFLWTEQMTQSWVLRSLLKRVRWVRS